MPEKEFKPYLKEARAYYKDVRTSRVRAHKFMQDTGILDKKGNLNTHYK